MYLILAVFIISLGGIIYMIGRKLIRLQNGEALPSLESPWTAEYMEDLKQDAFDSLKRFGYVFLVTIVRGYVRLESYLRKIFARSKTAITAYLEKRHGQESERKEGNKFLRRISEYKYKIRRIRDRVEKEENI